jgi:hypothetical protein
MHGMNECVICREELFIPVEMTCFQCYKKNQVSCSSFCRVCRKCAHRYLQLDRPLEHRDLLKRCLYCQALSSSADLSADTAYRKDYLLIGADSSTGHSCPYCSEFSGTQLAIDQHLDTHCPEMMILCACGRTKARRELEAHFTECSHRQLCSLCSVYLLESEKEEHMMHVHHYMKCTLCEAYVAYQGMTAHIMDECPFRMVHCEYCHGAVQHRRLPAHMEDHENEFHAMFTRLMRDITTALREFNRFRRVRSGRHLSD